TGELPPAHAAGFGPFLEAWSSGLFASARAVKGQIEGPITLSAYLFHQGSPFLYDPALFAAIAFHVSQTICWQIDRLKSAGVPVLMFVDEPALCLEVPAASVVSEEKRLSADRKSTRLNSSHDQISYAVFCLKKKKRQNKHN